MGINSLFLQLTVCVRYAPLQIIQAILLKSKIVSIPSAEPETKYSPFDTSTTISLHNRFHISQIRHHAHVIEVKRLLIKVTFI